MYCKKCGSKIDNNRTFCGYCGYSIEDDSKKTNPISNNQSINKNYQPKKSQKKPRFVSNKENVILNIVLGILLIISIVIQFTLVNELNNEADYRVKVAYLWGTWEDEDGNSFQISENGVPFGDAYDYEATYCEQFTISNYSYLSDFLELSEEDRIHYCRVYKSLSDYSDGDENYDVDEGTVVIEVVIPGKDEIYLYINQIDQSSMIIENESGNEIQLFKK